MPEDTLVKVSQYALTALVGYGIAMYKHRREDNNTYRDNRITLLKEAVEELQPYITSLEGLVAYSLHLSNGRSTEESVKLTPNQLSNLTGKSRKVHDTVEVTNKAISKLTLSKQEELKGIIKSFLALESLLREETVMANLLPTKGFMNKIINEFTKINIEHDRAVAKAFEDLHK